MLEVIFSIIRNVILFDNITFSVENIERPRKRLENQVKINAINAALRFIWKNYFHK